MTGGRRHADGARTPRWRAVPVLLVVAVTVSACGSSGATANGGMVSSGGTVPTTAPDMTIVPLCSDVAPLGPIRPGNHPGSGGPPNELQNTITAYAAEHPDAFAGWWLDREHGGTVVVAFTGDPDVHRAALLARSPQPGDPQVVQTVPRRTPSPSPATAPPATTVGESGWTVDVVRARHSDAELQALALRLYREWDEVDIPHGGYGTQPQLNRITISLNRADEATRRQLAARWPADELCAVEAPSNTGTWPNGPAVAAAIS